MVINKCVSECLILFFEIKLLECVDVSEGLLFFVCFDEMMCVGYLIRGFILCKCKWFFVVYFNVVEFGYFLY